MEIFGFGSCVVLAAAFVAGFVRGSRSKDGPGRAWSMGMAWMLFCGLLYCPISFVVAFWVWGNQTREFHLQARAELREDFPMESMADRLSYEIAHQSIGEAQNAVEDHKLKGAVENRLATFEKRSLDGYRYHALQTLHDKKRDEFIKNAGFGVMRMARIEREDVELPRTPPVPLVAPPEDEPPYVPDQKSGVPVADAGLSAESQLGENALMGLHVSGLEDFFKPERYGYVRDRNNVAGFQSHQFQQTPGLPTVSRESWQLTRLELVSLLKHETPVAYRSRNLPNLEDLQTTPTRPLDPFEQNALSRLNRDDDLVIDYDENRIRMVGSLRASSDCLKCHSVQRGKLLGAFSYELLRQRNNRPTGGRRNTDETPST